MQFDREAAKAAGYTDAEIDAYLAAKPREEQAAEGPVAPTSAEPPPPSTTIPEVDRTNEYMGTAGAYLGQAGNLLTNPLVDIVAGGYAGKKFIVDPIVNELKARNAIEGAREARMAARPGFGGAPASAPTPAPTAQPATTGGRLFAPGGGPTPAQVNAMPAAQSAPANNWMNRAMNMAKSVGPTVERYAGQAAQAVRPVAQAAAPYVETALRYAPAATAVQMMTQSKSLGPRMPEGVTTEINPRTRRPWTAEEIAQYNAAPRQ